MDTPKGDSHYELPLFQILSDPKIAALALKPPRPAILAALRTPDSASGLTRCPLADFPKRICVRIRGFGFQHGVPAT